MELPTKFLIKGTVFSIESDDERLKNYLSQEIRDLVEKYYNIRGEDANGIIVDSPYDK